VAINREARFDVPHFFSRPNVDGTSTVYRRGADSGHAAPFGMMRFLHILPARRLISS
jgi:hypothetical protein